MTMILYGVWNADTECKNGQTKVLKVFPEKQTAGFFLLIIVSMHLPHLSSFVCVEILELSMFISSDCF